MPKQWSMYTYSFPIISGKAEDTSFRCKSEVRTCIFICYKTRSKGQKVLQESSTSLERLKRVDWWSEIWAVWSGDRLTFSSFSGARPTPKNFAGKHSAKIYGEFYFYENSTFAVTFRQLALHWTRNGRMQLWCSQNACSSFISSIMFTLWKRILFFYLPQLLSIICVRIRNDKANQLEICW